jgi:glycosyltransferase involved in cell wall biosynthesis
VTLRVLHCIYDDPQNPWVGGGGALRVWELYRRLQGSVVATVATGCYPGARDETREGVRYVRLGSAASYPLSRATYGARATALLRSGNFDVGLFDFSAYTPVLLPSRPAVGLVVHMLHGPSAPARWGRIGGSVVAAVERRMLKRARWVCTTSVLLQEQLRLLLPHARVEIVPSGVADEFFDVERDEADYVLYYGRFDIFQKGIDTLIEAFGLLAEDHPDLRLRIAGRGKDTDAVHGLVDRSGYASRVSVHSTPDRKQVLELMSGARLLLTPSRVEGLPMAPAEAMAAGVPVIAAEVGAVSEVVVPPGGGALVAPGNAAMLAAAADRFLRDDRLREETSRTARISASRFSWDVVAVQHLGFLHAVAGNSRPVQ